VWLAECDGGRPLIQKCNLTEEKWNVYRDMSLGYRCAKTFVVPEKNAEEPDQRQRRNRQVKEDKMLLVMTI
jgi:hypothetical protein